MSQRTRKQKRESLIRRRNYLAARVKENRTGNTLSFDKAELAALSWALQVIDAAAQENVLQDLERVVVYNEGRGS